MTASPAQHATRPAAETRGAAQGPPPQGEHRGRRADSQPRDAERVHAREEQHRERGPEVMEHRADDEERVCWHAVGRMKGAPGFGDGGLMHGMHDAPSSGTITGDNEGVRRSMATQRRRNDAIAEAAPLDGVNRRLLAELQEAARLSLAELGRRVGLSAPAVAERLQRLEQSGVITGYRAQVDARALGLSLSAVLRIRPAPRQLASVADLARATEEVVECHRITGEDCFFMKLHVRDVEHLEEVIDRFALYGQTTTSIIQSSPVAGRGVAVGVSSQP